MADCAVNRKKKIDISRGELLATRFSWAEECVYAANHLVGCTHAPIPFPEVLKQIRPMTHHRRALVSPSNQELILGSLKYKRVKGHVNATT